MGVINIINVREGVFSVNSFNEPNVYKNKEAIALLLLRLLILEPGTNNSHPEMGVGIVSKFRFTMEDNLDDLELKIKEQINTYLPEFILQTIDLKLEDKVLYITIKVNDDYYGFTLDGETKILTISDLHNG